jgi:hypothetical protein
MIKQNTVVAKPTEVIPTDSKWVEGISSSQSVCNVASQVLHRRLKVVCHWLPLAAEESDEDIE